MSEGTTSAASAAAAELGDPVAAASETQPAWRRRSVKFGGFETQDDPSQRPYKDGFRRAKYIEACACNPDPNKPQMAFWCWEPTGEIATMIRGQFLCKSWRCEWGCAEHEAHVMFARIKEAFERVGAGDGDLVFCVLTLDSAFHKLPFYVLDEVYMELRQRLEWFRKRLRRQLKKQGLDDFGKRWVAVVEQHASGVPHVNLIIHAPRWANHLQTQYLRRRAEGQTPRNARLIASTNERRDAADRIWLRMLTECGFGFASTAERAKSNLAVIGYAAQVAKNADETATRMHDHFVKGGAGAEAHKPLRKRRRRPRRREVSPLQLLGEIAKKRQLPLRAPKNFRRLRSGKGFLPPRQKGTKTGTVLHHVCTEDGYHVVRPMGQTRDPERAKMVAMAVDLERDRHWRGQQARDDRALNAKIRFWEKEVKGLNGTKEFAGRGAMVKAAYERLGELRRARRDAARETLTVTPELRARFGVTSVRPVEPPVSRAAGAAGNEPPRAEQVSFWPAGGAELPARR